MRRAAFVVALLLGLGLVAAPVAFDMFDAAPKGAEMIDEFRPYVNEPTMARFRGYMDTMAAAESELRDTVYPALGGDTGTTYPASSRFADAWAGIDDDMGGMLEDITTNIGNYEAVDALPTFSLFPWFFVLPGTAVAGAALWGIRNGRPGASTRGPAIAIVVLGVCLLAAPAVFQMFTRAPKGGDMMDTFRPLMVRDRVQRIQGYFVTIGAGEGELRRFVLVDLSSLDDPPPTPAIDAFVERWPEISREMAPMMGTMSDNVDNYEAVDGLPSFPLFPWFFAIPGLILVVLGLVARPASNADPVPAAEPATTVYN